MSTSDRKKPGRAFWASVVMVVVLVLLIAYPLSIAPTNVSQHMRHSTPRGTSGPADRI
jgi:hypothetical protein